MKSIISKLLAESVKPEIYTKGSAIMWTDPYISKQLLETHLNPELDLGSRKPETITKTVDWVLSQMGKDSLNILDLGCGPGLYSEIFAAKGHHITAVDFSENSINYAQKEARKKNLNIRYIQGNYLDINLEENQFDLVLLIFTDFGPLLPDERSQLLYMVRKVLKQGGVFIFDVLNEKNFQSKLSPRNWEVSNKGFWRDKPYIALSDSFLYEREKLILYQHLVIDEQENIETYRFWNHFFSDSDLEEILFAHGFTDISFYRDIIPNTDSHHSDEVTFCIVTNK